MTNILITGANRGLGLEFVKQYLTEGARIFACCRDPQKADKLNEVATSFQDKVTVHKLDVADFAQIDALASELKDESIDILLNNAGVYPDGRGANNFGKLDYDAWITTLHINTLAPIKMAETFVEHIARSQDKKIVIITSQMGSITDNTSGGSYMYRSSKSAVNSAGKCLAYELKGRGVATILLHPGWVVTDMGGANATLKVTESITRLRKVIANTNIDDTGKFLSHDGSEIPW